MTVFAVILLIALGILLVLLEILVIPGTTIAGVGGILFLAGGIYFAYDKFGTTVGHYILLGVILFIILSLYFSLKSKTWSKLMLHSKIESKTNIIDEDKVKKGDSGVTITRLAPMGRVLINGENVEAKSEHFIDQNVEIEVEKILDYKIIVKLKNK